LRLEDEEEPPLASFVEDEPLVRQFVSTVLQGWSVLDAANAIAALAMANSEPLQVPVMTEQIHAFDDLPVLVGSGKARGLHGRASSAHKSPAEDRVPSMASLLD